MPYYWWVIGNNFGDNLSPEIASRILQAYANKNNYSKINLAFIRRDLDISENISSVVGLGSIFDHAVNKDVIWMSGFSNPNTFMTNIAKNDLDIRGVRGPRTREFLMNTYGMTIPEVYGDPGLLLPLLFPEFKRQK